MFSMTAAVLSFGVLMLISGLARGGRPLAAAGLFVLLFVCLLVAL